MAVSAPASSIPTPTIENTNEDSTAVPSVPLLPGEELSDAISDSQHGHQDERELADPLSQIAQFRAEMRHGGQLAASARALVTSSLDEQVLFVARFLAQRSFPSAVSRTEPGEDDFRRVARYYNGPGYAAHHYHESLERWFREFRYLQDAL